MSELKPCPFCGYELPSCEGLIKAEFAEDGILQHPTGVCCSNCGCYQVGGETIDEAVKAWNTRANESQWIPCSERLPENDEILCVIYARNDYEFAWWHEGAKAWDSPDIGWIDANEVSNYIPLPSEPK